MPASERLGVRLRRATFAVRRLLMSHLAPMGITHEQYLILLFLGEQHGSTQRELAQRSFTNPNTVTEILNRLERDGLVRRVRHGSDRRAFRVEITPKGQQLRQRLVAIADDIVKRVFENLEAQERTVLLRALDGVADAADRALDESKSRTPARRLRSR